MAEPGLDRRVTLDALKEQLRQRFPGATALDRPHEGVLPTGLDAVDALLPGGVPRGAISLLTGPPSSGRTSLALACAARWTAQEGTLAWLHRGGLSAPSAAWAGVDLRRLLHVRAESGVQALRCLDHLLRWQAFALVVADWEGPTGRGADWSRIQRLVAGSRTALMLLAPPRPAGDPLRFIAAVHLAVRRLDGQGTCGVELLRSRYAAGAARAVLHRDGPEAPFALLPELPGLGQSRWDEVGSCR